MNSLTSQLDTVLALEQLEQEMRRLTHSFGGNWIAGKDVDDWIEKLAAIRAAVGGEAIKPLVRFRHGDPMTGKPITTAPTATVDVGALQRALTEYPDKNPQQSQAHKVCAGVLKLAASYAGEER